MSDNLVKLALDALDLSKNHAAGLLDPGHRTLILRLVNALQAAEEKLSAMTDARDAWRMAAEELDADAPLTLQAAAKAILAHWFPSDPDYGPCVRGSLLEALEQPRPIQSVNALLRGLARDQQETKP